MRSILTKRIELNTTTRTVLFGIVSGMIWSALAENLISGDEFKSYESAIAVGAGVLTGILVSFMLKSRLAKCGRMATFGFGLLSLPTGAFFFGVLNSLGQFIATRITGIEYPSFSSDPIENGITLALLSVISLLAVILFPLAVFTTFLLRTITCSTKKS
jgi:hypothetical protein